MANYTETKPWLAYRALAASRPEEFRQSPELQIIFDELVVNEYVSRTGKSLGVVYQSPWNTFVVDLVRNPAGELFSYDRLLPTADGVPVVTVPVCDGKFILLNQFRHALRGTHWGFPRGYGEVGLSAAENACKELEEELGAQIDPAGVQDLGMLYSDSGMSGAAAHVVLCPITWYELKKEYEGIVDVAALSEEELQQWIKNGTITDGFTLSAWCRYKNV